MKTVYSNREIPHLWAHKTQDSARNANGSFFFRNGIIFSYGEHFPIAKHVTGRKGQPGVLFTSKSYSNTTARHCSRVRGAIPPELPVFVVSDVLSKPTREDLLNFETDAATHYNKAQRARSDWSRRFHAKGAAALLKTAAAFAAFYGWKYTPPALADIGPELAKRTKAEQARQKREQAKAEKAAEAAKQKAIAEEKEAIDAFLSRTRAEVFHRYLNPVLRIDGNEVLTSRGATAPLDHVRKAWAFLKPRIEAGTPWQSNGHTLHVGNFQIDYLTVEGELKAGCHIFDKTELLRFGAILDTI